MKIITLYAATLLAIKAHAEEGEPFSARDITEYVEGELADNEYELPTGEICVDHDIIRRYVHEIMDNDLLTLSLGNFTFRKDYPTNAVGDSYKEYSVVFDGNIASNDIDDDLFTELQCPSNTDTFGDQFSYSCSTTAERGHIVVEDGKVSITGKASIVVEDGNVSITVE